MTQTQTTLVLRILGALPETQNPRSRLLAVVLGNASARMLNAAGTTAAALRILRSIIRAQVAMI